jgi:hypothetical protein
VEAFVPILSDEEESELLAAAARRFSVLSNSGQTLAGIVSLFRHDPDALDQFVLAVPRDPSGTVKLLSVEDVKKLGDHLRAKKDFERRERRN